MSESVEDPLAEVAAEPGQPVDVSLLPDQPSVDVKLSIVELNRIAEFINNKSLPKNDACPVCGSSLNVVAEHIYKIDTRKTLNFQGGLHQPLITTVCYNCGFVRLFNENIVRSQIEKEDTAASGPNDGT